jgi:hypothetical protein
LGECGIDVVVNCFGCIVLNSRTVLNGELKRIGKKTGVTYFKVLYPNICVVELKERDKA